MNSMRTYVGRLLRRAWLPALMLLGMPVSYALAVPEPARWTMTGACGVLAVAAYRWVRAAGVRRRDIVVYVVQMASLLVVSQLPDRWLHITATVVLILTLGSVFIVLPIHEWRRQD